MPAALGCCQAAMKVRPLETEGMQGGSKLSLYSTGAQGSQAALAVCLRLSN